MGFTFFFYEEYKVIGKIEKIIDLYWNKPVQPIKEI